MLVEEEEMKIGSDWGKLGGLFSGKRVVVSNLLWEVHDLQSRVAWLKLELFLLKNYKPKVPLVRFQHGS